MFAFVATNSATQETSVKLVKTLAKQIAFGVVVTVAIALVSDAVLKAINPNTANPS